MGAPAFITDTTIAFLRTHPPFLRMTPKELEMIAAHARLAYFPVGTAIVDPAVTQARHLFILQRGHVRSYNAATQGDDVVHDPGECFPVGALTANSPGTRRYDAIEDAFCLQLDKEHFDALRAASPVFSDYCTQAMASIVQQSVGALRTHYSQRAAEQQSLLQPLGKLIRRAPIACEQSTPLRGAIATMRDEAIGTMVVVDAGRRPVGVFTLTDLRDRVVLAQADLDAPISAVMSVRPAALDESATAQDAMQIMAQRGYHQVLVTRGGEIAGVVSERDLFSLQRVSMRNVLQSIHVARDIAELKHIVSEIGMLTENLIAQGASAEPLTHTISALNDALTQRLFDLVTPRFDLDGRRWCWLSLGSEGRREQTVATDQDNALIFECDEDEVTAMRVRFLPFARAINEALADLGFPLCPGNIMAGNRDWCLSVDEWRERFAGWIREPTPQALLNANIFFDFRPLVGEPALAEGLRRWLSGVTEDNRLFLRLMVANALQCEPPLGMIRTFKVDEGDNAGTIDLKSHGTRIFVDAARTFALGLGVGETNSAARLRLAARKMSVDERHVDATVDAFNYLQMLRLRAQWGEWDAPDAAARDAHRAVNRIDPYKLNELDQRMLKEALRQARQLQARLEQTFGR